MDLFRQRLDLGRERYGHGVRSTDDTRKWGTPRNSWMDMCLEELLDGAIYVCADYIRFNWVDGQVGHDDNDIILDLLEHPEQMSSSSPKHFKLVMTLKGLIKIIGR
jgi:hypothetical protein